MVAAAALLSLQMQRIRDMGAALAAGDLEAQLDTEKMFSDVKRHAEGLMDDLVDYDRLQGHRHIAR